MKPLARASRGPETRGPPSRAELERAARILAVRARRETSGAFAGAYRSAFRGGGLEFEESRPYAPGDDVRAIDWNALARRGELFVKRFREERDRTLWLAVDVSASMGFASRGPGKAAAAAHAAALLAAAAARAGDRVALLLFDAEVRESLPPARGGAQLRGVLDALVRGAGEARGATSVAAALARIRARAAPRSAVVLLSDLRDPALAPAEGGDASGGAAAQAGLARAELRAAARSHDLVVIAVHDPREERIPDVGTVRLADPEAPRRTLLLRTGSRRGRERYRAAASARRAATLRRLRAEGVQAAALRAGADPLPVLARLFRSHRGRERARGRA